MELQEKHRRHIVIVILTMMPLVGMGIDLYTPSFPALVTGLQTRRQLVQLTIPTYFFGYTLAQFFVGPLSDTIGRRKVLLGCMIFYTVISFLSSFSPDIYTLMLFRFMQGVGISPIAVTARSVASDAFEGKRRAAVVSYMVLGWSLGPLVGPLIGGYLEVYFGWQANFYFFALYGLLVLIVAFLLLPETHKHVIPFHPMTVLKNYIETLKCPQFIGGVLCIALINSMIIVFNLMGPFFIQDILHYSPIGFGHMAFIAGSTAFVGNIFNRFLIQHKSIHEISMMGIYAILAVSLLMVIGAYIWPVNLYMFLAPILVIIFLGMPVLSNCTTQTLVFFSKKSGTASALMGVLFILIMGITSALSSFLKSNTSIPISWAFLMLAIACYLAFTFLLSRKSKNETRENAQKN